MCEKCLDDVIKSVKRTDNYEEWRCSVCGKMQNNGGKPRWGEGFAIKQK